MPFPPLKPPRNTPDKYLSSTLDSTFFNTALNLLGPVMKAVSVTKRADRGTRGIFDVLDVAGYNYGSLRFRRDANGYPARIIVGTEDMPGSIASIWPVVESVPNVIGDFLWAGWDYLGEVGVGHWVHGKRIAPMMKRYPYLTSGSGVIDITGTPTQASAVSLGRPPVHSA